MTIYLVNPTKRQRIEYWLVWAFIAGITTVVTWVVIGF